MKTERRDRPVAVLLSDVNGSEFPEKGGRDFGNPRLWILLLLALVLRLYRLEHQSLWWDEGWQFYVASAGSVGDALHRYLDPRVTAHPPLSHAVSYLFLRAGRSDLVFRLPSVFFGAGALIVTYFLVVRLASRRAALWAVLFMAISPYHVWYSQEARMYAQLMFVAPASTLLLVRAVERPRAGRWVVYALSIAASVYTHVYAAFGILGHMLWLLGWHRRQFLRGVASSIAALVLFTPMLGFFVQRLGEQHQPFASAGFNPAGLPYAAFVYSVGQTIGPSVVELKENPVGSFALEFAPLIGVVLVVFGALVVTGALCAYRGRGAPGAALIALGLVVPLVGPFLVSLVPTVTFNVRYTSWAFPFFAALVGAGLAWLLSPERTRRWPGVVALLAVLGLSSVSLYNLYTNPRYAKEDIRAAVAHWRRTDAAPPLISYNGSPTVERYLTPDEERRHYPLYYLYNYGERIASVLEQTGESTVCVLLARDWRQILENRIREKFAVVSEESFPGAVRLLRVRRQG
jgi:4-amino-4-deoxy-L-arabinose transferase-like glycosyltransferase